MDVATPGALRFSKEHDINLLRVLAGQSGHANPFVGLKVLAGADG